MYIGVPNSVISSRRSSLRSTSVYELEGIARPESPGPPPTDDPLEGLPAPPPPPTEIKQQTLPSSVAGSRRSSLSSSLMPEVVVTQVMKRKKSQSIDDSADGDQEDEGRNTGVKGDETKLQPPEKGMRIWNLLPVNSFLKIYLANALQ